MITFNPSTHIDIRVHSHLPARQTDDVAAAQDRVDPSQDSTGNTSQDPLALSAELTEAEQQQVQKLQARDREVRTHEQAHLSAAGGLAIGGASFTFQAGPNGQRYAVGGEVSIDTSAVPGDPKATLQKAETIRRAALAPAEPSSQDFRVAAEASQMAARARQELAQLQRDPLAQSSVGGSIDIRI